MNNYPPRPVITKDVVKKAALETAKHTPNISENQVDELADAITKCYSPHDNGYDLTKKLEEHILHGFNFDSMFVESMDFMDSNVDELHEEECKQWVKDHDIKPPLPIGTLIKEGEITGIYTFRSACYLVKLYGHDDSKNNSRRIIKFEDAVINEPNQPAVDSI